ncbi:MAG: hypothetical protein QOH28_1242 [Actinomycetota bacterium]|jgi:hypothetical protein|nr:hypothetical protein [Actinomycetota bacterium]
MRLTTGKLALRAIIVVGVLAVAPSAYAAKGGGKSGGGSGGGSVRVVNVTAPGTAPSHGQTITFSVTSSASQPYVQLNCFQGGSIVYSHQAGFYAGYPWSHNYVLSSNSWVSGSAACTATLEHNSNRGTTVTDATLNFTVNA